MPILPQTHPLKKVEDRVKNRQMSRRVGATLEGSLCTDFSQNMNQVLNSNFPAEFSGGCMMYVKWNP